VEVKFQSVIIFGTQWKSVFIAASGSFYPRIKRVRRRDCRVSWDAESAGSAREPILLNQIAREPVRTLRKGLKVSILTCNVLSVLLSYLV